MEISEVFFEVKPRAGSALFFYTLTEEGSIDFNSLHAGAEVFSGTKYFMNLWVRDQNLKYSPVEGS